MIFRVFTRSLLAVLFAISGKAQFEIRGSRLYFEGSPFTVRGVAYSPTPIGETASPLLRLSGCVYARDFALAARAGINTLRIYGRIPTEENAFWQALTQNNLYVLAGFPLDPYHDPQATLGPESALRARVLQDFRAYADRLRSQRRVIAIVFGNEVAKEYGRKFGGSVRDFYSLVEEAASSTRELLVTTAVTDPAEVIDVPGLAFWSVNLYRGTTFENAFDELRRKTVKPVLVSEFGIDAWDSVRRTEDSASQAAGLRTLVRLLNLEMIRTDSTVFGGVWFGWTDEWWRGGPDPSRHGADAAWFGLFGVSATDLPGLDSLRARPAFRALAEEWGGRLPQPWPPAPRLRPQGVVNAGSLAPVVAPGSLVAMFGEELSEKTDIELTTACVAGRPAPLLAATPSQINGQIPPETPAGSAPVIVYRAGTASNVAPVEVRPVAPGILDRGVVEAGRPCPVSVASGVRPGAYLEIYGTGLAADIVPRAFLGPREVRVFYSGLVSGFPGLYQINTQVPEDFPPFSPVGLKLFAGEAESNTYPMTVLSEAERPGFTLGPDNLQFLAQAGGPPQSAELAIEARNGFCELVRFSVAGMPEGVSVSIPVGYPGQRVPVTVQAGPQARGYQDVPITVQAVSALPENPVARLRVSVLPSRGDIPFRVVSGGGRAGLIARFEMAGRLLYEARGGGAGRGFSFLPLDGHSGVLGPARSFDTWSSERASEEMADYLAALPIGTVVLGAIADEGSLNLTPRGRAALREILRSQFIDTLRYQDSWAIIGRVGAALPAAEEIAADRQVVLERVLTFPAQ